ncbi:hypothetical protein PHSY_000314 [Pseudozyma hubeiensis SY62]|uniref:Transcription regulator Rua1 C-terminal domain-containing protein n=1 Tax=Pseudozyma hubeiensis (strain SY62) TaxID=1305764 RepID=R9NW78_PSEHS|nr:hypothetical protein PHSY_000314 [Pseudozyma hubeiensis SY62]GAC92759.1 hypothetical protein PHSY_000314 [Pseudozyma hubeiensis SY62]
MTTMADISHLPLVPAADQDSKPPHVVPTPTYASLSAYNIGQKIESTPALPMLDGLEGTSKSDLLIDQLLTGPPSPTTNLFDDVWSHSMTQFDSSNALTPSTALLDGVGDSDTTLSESESVWSDFLMPLLATVGIDYPVGSASVSESAASSSSACFSTCSTVTNATPQRQTSNGIFDVASILPVSSSSHEDTAPTHNDNLTYQDCTSSSVKQENLTTVAPIVDHQNQSGPSLYDNNWTQVTSLAPWLHQDVSCTSNQHHEQHHHAHQQLQDTRPKQSRTNGGSSSRQATRPSSPKQQSRPRPQLRSRSSTSSQHAWNPLMDPQVLLWAAVMMNGLSQAQAGAGDPVTSPFSDYSASMYDVGQEWTQDDEVAFDDDNGDEAMDESEDVCEDQKRMQSDEGGSLSSQFHESPEPSSATLEPMAALARAAESISRSSSWPMLFPPDMLDLQQSLLRAHPMFGRPASRRHHHSQQQQQQSARRRTRTSISSMSTGLSGTRKPKQDAVRTSAIRSKRQSCVDAHHSPRSRSSSSASESRGETEKKDVKAQSQCASRPQAGPRLPPSRTSSYSRPSDSGSGIDALSISAWNGTTNASDMTATSSAGSTSTSLGFTITDKIVLRPRPGSGDEELAYPFATDSLLDTQYNRGPTIDAQHQAEEAVEKVANLFPSDLYAPRFTRRGKCGREGWCSLCPQGDWYSMKRSQYLYHMQFDHGISNLTRRFFHPPQTLRVWNDAVSKTDGLCHHCNKWIPICFGPQRKRDFKAWFKHARKCHRDDTGCPI